MKVSTQATSLALLALTALVLCQNVVSQDVVSEAETEVKNEVINAADIVCQAFSPDEDNQTNPQPAKRGFFDKLWDDVKDTVVGTAVKNALESVGKRDPKPWKKSFSSDKGDQTERQLSRRGFFSKLWADVKGVVVGTAVKNALQGLGKRDSKPWNSWWRNRTELYEKSRDAKDAEAPSGFCDPEYLNQIETLEQALEVLGTITSLVQSLKKCV